MHKGFISAIRFANGQLFSGAKDGIIKVMTPGSLEVTKSIDMGCLVRAIDCCPQGNLLVGTRDGTITGIMGDNRKEIMKSHSDGEVWGLAQDNSGAIITSGDDNKVMFWDPANRCNTKTVKVSDKRKKAARGGASTLSKLPDSQCSRAVAVNSDYLAIAANDGTVHIRTCADPNNNIAELTDSREWIEVMAFSPNNELLAVGSHDNNIYIYSTANWGLVGTCKGHNSYIMALDWCEHSKYIRSNCGAYELLFFTGDDWRQDPSGRTNTKATVWATKTVKFAWDVQGIYPKGTDGTHINSVDASHDRQLFATGDDFGLVCLFRDPVIKGCPRSFRGHSEHVVRVMFSNDDGYLYSIGGYDQTLMQWKRC